MAEFNGMQKIGSLLFGGAGRMRDKAYEEGRLSTAKTEDALASARLKQSQATAAANQQRAHDKWKESFIAIESAKPGADPKEVATRAEFIGNTILGGLGGDYSSTMTGMETGQEIGFRDVLASDDATAQERLHAGFGVQGKVTPDIAPVGTHGTVNLNDEDQVLAPATAKPTSAIANYEYSEKLPPEARQGFSPFVRADQIVQAGNVPVVRQATTGTTQEVVSAAQVAQNKADVAEGSKIGQYRATQKADYPRVKYTLEQNKLKMSQSNKIAQEIYDDEKLWQAVGLTQLVSKVPGTDGAYIRARLETLRSQTMLQTLLNLREMSKTGGAVGNVSDREGLVMEKAIAALSNPDITTGDFRRELGRLMAYNGEIEKLLDQSFADTYDDKGNPKLTLAPRGAEGTEGSEDTAYSNGEAVEPKIEEIILNEGLGTENDNGDIVDDRGWILMTSPGGAAWQNPANPDEYEEVAQ